jgi:hypothetical protein
MKKKIEKNLTMKQATEAANSEIKRIGKFTLLPPAKMPKPSVGIDGGDVMATYVNFDGTFRLDKTIHDILGKWGGVLEDSGQFLETNDRNIVFAFKDRAAQRSACAELKAAIAH